MTGRQLGFWIALVALIMTASPAAAQRFEFGRAGQGWLGIAVAPVRTGPAAVEDVMPDSPAGRAGLEEGDTIVQWNGSGDVLGAIDRGRLEPGDTVKLRVRRDGEVRGVTITAGTQRGGVIAFGDGGDFRFVLPDDERVRFFADSVAQRMDSLQLQMRRMLRDSLGPKLRDLHRNMPELRSRLREMDSTMVWPFGRGPDNGAIVFPDARDGEWNARFGPSMIMFDRGVAGAEFADVNRELGSYFGTDRGALVLRVSPDTPAARAGLRAGDVVVRVNDEHVDDVDDLREAVARASFRGDGKEMIFEVIREGSSTELRLGR